VELHPGDSIKYAEAVVDLTLTGTSAIPFHYTEDYVTYTYGTTYAGDDGNITGGDPMFDFTPFLPPNPLRVGDLVNGQTVRGLVGLRMTLDAQYVLALNDSHSGKPLAEWRLTSTK
jgi:hypothetical protein